MEQFVAIDLGGTNIRAARYDQDARQLARSQRLTGAEDGSQVVTERIIACIRDVMPDDANEVTAMALGAPGPLNPKTGVVIAPPNLPLKNFGLRDVLRSEFGRPAFIGNDANLAALAEWKFGAGQGYDDVLYLTISTGIGSGIVSGGRMLLGKDGLGAEAGHTTAVPDGPICGCGQRGHLEAVASGPAIARSARGRIRAGAKSKILDLASGNPEHITAVEVGRAAMDGDPLAIELLAEAGHWIGRSVADFLHILNSGIVIFGGGVSNTGDYLLDPVRRAIQKYCISREYWDGVPVVQAKLGDDVGLLGALALAVEESRQLPLPTP